ncbi:hypothetical protein G3I01_03935 [Gramella sp. MT6]|uniref:hypothetical protein n=1 Tax=Gramella sp. MT6 TaxID=2705471 RepID=UPI001C5D8242|nr:hypothetical protein [Gramella sp. MT6]QYA24691.1 hypothetical protein G3I01_03935 [Gramella sp. MT6]
MKKAFTLLLLFTAFSIQSQTFQITKIRDLETKEISKVDMTVNIEKDTIFISEGYGRRHSVRKGVIRDSYEVKNKYLGKSTNLESIVQNEPVLLDITYKPESNKKFILLTEVNILDKTVKREKLFFE